jgi:two-component system, LuxR family, sensor kinase FixL
MNAPRAAETVQMMACVLQSMAEPVLVLDETGLITYTNPTLDATVGYRPGQLLGQHVFLLSTLPPEARVAAFRQVLTQVKAGARVRGEYELRRQNGTTLQVETHTSAMEQGGRFYLVAVGRDITQRKQAEADLRQAEAKYRAIVATAMDGFALIDPLGRIAEVNDAHCRMVGYTREEMLGMSIAQLEAAESPEEVAAHVRRVQQTGSDQFETRQRRKDGSTVDLEISASRLGSGPGSIIAFARDITQRKKAEAKRLRLERQLLEISDREQARIGQELHDGLCQQLVGLAFDANSLEQRLDTQDRKGAQTARRLAKYLDQAITEARQLSRGLFPARLEADGLPAALENLAQSTRERFHIQCDFEMTGLVKLPGPAVAVHLYRIAQEAIHNAVKHSLAQRIAVRLQGGEEQAVLTVQDAGKGIGVGAVEKPEGLGLHIMDYRARTIGGTLRVNRGPAGGTVVSCIIPSRQR